MNVVRCARGVCESSGEEEGDELPIDLLMDEQEQGTRPMTKAKRERRERTDNWKLIQQWCRCPEQRLYERIRPIVLYGTTPAERTQETELPERSLRRSADTFGAQGMRSLTRSKRRFAMRYGA